MYPQYNLSTFPVRVSSKDGVDAGAEAEEEEVGHREDVWAANARHLPTTSMAGSQLDKTSHLWGLSHHSPQTCCHTE